MRISVYAIMTGKCSGVFSSMRSLGKPSKGRDPFLTLEEFRCDSCDSDNVSAAISASKEIPGLQFHLRCREGFLHVGS